MSRTRKEIIGECNTACIPHFDAFVLARKANDDAFEIERERHEAAYVAARKLSRSNYVAACTLRVMCTFDERAKLFVAYEAACKPHENKRDAELADTDTDAEQTTK